MRNVIQTFFTDSIEIKKSILQDESLLSLLESAGQLFVECKHSNGTIFTCGNGGSTCDAIHLAEELVARYKRERPGIKAMHFCDASTLTCWSNDYDFEGGFERQAQTFCGPKDVLVGISTSGNSENVVRAAKAAHKNGTKVIGFLGKGGGKLADLCDVPLIVPSDQTDRIQEVHVVFLHILCEIIETVDRSS